MSSVFAVISDHSLGLLLMAFSALLVILFARMLCFSIVVNSDHKIPSEHHKTSTASKHAEFEREMDFFELVFDEMHEVGGGNICCGFALKSRKSLRYDNVHRALSCVSRKYPLLRTVIVKRRDGNENMVKLLRILDVNRSKIDLKQASLDGSEWVQAWEHEVRRKFDREKGPLWRATLLRECYEPDTKEYHNTLLFTFYHGILDGMSVLKFAKEFTSCLQEISKGHFDFESDANCDRMPMQKGVLTMLAPRQFLHYKIMQCFFPPSVLVHIIKFIMRVNIMFDARNPIIERFAKSLREVRDTDKKIRLIPRQLTSGKTEKLMMLCRRNRCTVQGAMLACCHLASARLVQDGGMKSPVKLGWQCPVNVRFQCVPQITEANNLGSYTTILMENVKVPEISGNNPKDFWKFAVQCTQAVHGGIRRGRHLFPLYLLPIAHLLKSKEFVSEFLLHSKMKASELFSPAHVLTNLGKIEWRKAAPDAEYEIENVFGGAGAYRRGATFMNHIATFNGVFTWSTSYFTGNVTDEGAQQYVTFVFDILQSILVDKDHD